MAYIEFNLDGKIIKMQDKIPEEETGKLEREKEFDKTQEFEPLTEEDINDKTLSDVFGDNHE